MKTIKNTLLLLAFVAAAACTTQEDDGGNTTPPGPTCDGDGMCESGESNATCARDCPNTTNPCDGDGTCDAGESTATCASDCPADEGIPTSEADKTCTTYTKGGRTILSCLARDLAGQPNEAWFVGVALSLNLNGYEKGIAAGTAYKAAKITRPDGRQAYEMDITALDPNEPLEVTYGYFNSSNVFVWALYGDNVYPNGMAGPYRECGWRNYLLPGNVCDPDYRCAIFGMAVPGHRAEPLGYYIVRNECN